MAHTTRVALNAEHGKCPLRTQNHQLWQCEIFLKKSVDERWRVVKDAHLCFNCLRSKSHIATDCASSGRCKVIECKKRHNSQLHLTLGSKSLPSSAEERNNATESTRSHTITTALRTNWKARLKVMPVQISPAQVASKPIQTYAFLDDGANATLCTTRLMKRLGIYGAKEETRFSTVFGEKTQLVYELDLKVRGTNETKEFTMTNVYALPSLRNVSSDIVTERELKERTHLEGIEIPTLKSVNVDLLVGVDNIQCLVVTETRTGKENQSLGIHTDLGWAVVGNDASGNGRVHTLFSLLLQENMMTILHFSMMTMHLIPPIQPMLQVCNRVDRKIFLQKEPP